MTFTYPSTILVTNRSAVVNSTVEFKSTNDTIAAAVLNNPGTARSLVAILLAINLACLVLAYYSKWRIFERYDMIKELFAALNSGNGSIQPATPPTPIVELKNP